MYSTYLKIPMTLSRRRSAGADVPGYVLKSEPLTTVVSAVSTVVQ